MVKPSRCGPMVERLVGSYLVSERRACPTTAGRCSFEVLGRDPVLPARNGSCSCVDDDAQGQSLDVLWESEHDAEIRNGENWQQMTKRGFDPAKRFATYSK
jgi:hypothetical protein